MTPAGTISFVSKPYGGRVSDNAIFLQSGLMDRILPGEKIMTDKGFLIDELCRQNGIGLIRPPFLKKRTKFTYEESILNAKIASARVHIERTNQRIKVFKILTNKLPITLIPLVGDIFIIACGVTNLSSPILSSDKFM